MAVKIVTDSMADLPPRVVEELGITVIPINIHFGTEVYRDGIDITTPAGNYGAGIRSYESRQGGSGGSPV